MNRHRTPMTTRLVLAAALAVAGATLGCTAQTTPEPTPLAQPESTTAPARFPTPCCASGGRRLLRGGRGLARRHRALLHGPRDRPRDGPPRRRVAGARRPRPPGAPRPARGRPRPRPRRRRRRPRRGHGLLHVPPRPARPDGQGAGRRHPARDAPDRRGPRRGGGRDERRDRAGHRLRPRPRSGIGRPDAHRGRVPRVLAPARDARRAPPRDPARRAASSSWSTAARTRRSPSSGSTR